MVRILISIAGLWIVSCGVHAAEVASGHEVTISIDLSYVDVSGLPSWTDGSVGKLRYSDDGLVMSRMFVNYSGRISDTLDANIVLDAYDDDLGNAKAVEEYIRHELGREFPAVKFVVYYTADTEIPAGRKVEVHGQMSLPLRKPAQKL